MERQKARSDLGRAFCVRSRISGRGNCCRGNRHRYCAIRRHHRHHGSYHLLHLRHHGSCLLLLRDSFRRHQSYGLVQSNCGWERSTSAKVPSTKAQSNCDSEPSRNVKARNTNARAPSTSATVRNSCGSARSRRMKGDCCSCGTAAHTTGCCRSSTPGDCCCSSESWGAIAAGKSGCRPTSDCC